MKERRLLSLILAAVMALTMTAAVPAWNQPAFASGAEDHPAEVAQTVCQPLQTQVAEIDGYGNTRLALTIEEFENAGYKLGDVLNVSFRGTTITIPYCSSPSAGDVAFHEAQVNRAITLGILVLAVNSGSFAENYGLSPGDSVTISLQDAGGYRDILESIQLGSYSTDRSDFPDLADEQFANFRAVSTTGMREKVLYRAASPVNPKHNRNFVVDALIAKAGVGTVLNLSDKPEDLATFDGYEQSYYATHTKHLEIGMKPNYGEPTFNDAVAQGMKFLIDPETPAPYEVNCVEGKDRTGFVIAVLECLAGASFDELIDDYMVTYYNYYYVKKEEARYYFLADFNLIRQMEYAFGVKSLSRCDLKASAEAYLEKCGLTEAEIVELAKVFSTTNPLMARAKTVKVSRKALKKHAKTFAVTKAFTVKYPAGAVTFSKLKGDKRILIAKSGKVTLKKGLKKKTYTVKTKISAAGDGDVSPVDKTVTLKVQVK